MMAGGAPVAGLGFQLAGLRASFDLTRFDAARTVGHFAGGDASRRGPDQRFGSTAGAAGQLHP